jgi:hypothetical protein
MGMRPAASPIVPFVRCQGRVVFSGIRIAGKISTLPLTKPVSVLRGMSFFVLRYLLPFDGLPVAVLWLTSRKEGICFVFFFLISFCPSLGYSFGFFFVNRSNGDLPMS